MARRTGMEIEVMTILLYRFAEDLSPLDHEFVERAFRKAKARAQFEVGEERRLDELFSYHAKRGDFEGVGSPLRN